MLIHKSPTEDAKDLLDNPGFVKCDESFLDINTSPHHNIVATNEGLMTLAQNYTSEDIKLCSDCFFDDV